MNAKDRWLLGLQWGACAWLPWVLRDAAHDFYYQLYFLEDVADEWPRLWWTPAYVVLFPGWIAAVALLVAGSRRARPAIAAMSLARVAVAWVETLATQMPDGGAQYVVPLLLPLFPLVALRVEAPRIVIALAALGRWREALARSGGVLALLVALAVLSTRHAGVQALVFRCDLPTACGVTSILAALASLVTLGMWATRRRTVTMT